MWFWLPPDQMADYLRGQGFDPADYPTLVAQMEQPESFNCQLCGELINNNHLYIELDPPTGATYYNKRKYHQPCLVAHLLEHANDMTDEISNYLSRRPI